MDEYYKTSYTPLYYLCEEKSTTFEHIKLLIEYGADVNKGTMKPLIALCKSNPQLVDGAQLLIEHGALVNDKCDIDNSTFSPLSARIHSYQMDKETEKQKQIELLDLENSITFLKENDELTKLLISQGENEEESRQLALVSISNEIECINNDSFYFDKDLPPDFDFSIIF